jgi:hypothetical protein
VEWSAFDNEDETGLFPEDTDAVGQGNVSAPAARKRNPRRTIEIIREQQQLRELLGEYVE